MKIIISFFNLVCREVNHIMKLGACLTFHEVHKCKRDLEMLFIFFYLFRVCRAYAVLYFLWLTHYKENVLRMSLKI